MSLNPKYYVTVEDFKENKEKAIRNYITQKQFYYENPINISEVKDLIGDNYRIWMMIYKDRNILKMRKKEYNDYLKGYSFSEILLAYSFVIEKNDKAYLDFNYLNIVGLDLIIKNIKFSSKSNNIEKGTIFQCHFMLEQYLFILNAFDVFDVVVDLYIQDRLNLSKIDDSILFEIVWGNDSEKLFLCISVLFSEERGSTKYKEVEKRIDYLIQNKRKDVNFLLRKENYNKDYKQNVLLKLQENYIKKKINFQKNFMQYDKIDDLIVKNFLLFYVYIKNDFDNTDNFITSKFIIKEILSFYFIKYQHFNLWEDVPLNEFNYFVDRIPEDRLKSLKKHYRRIKYNTLIKNIKIFFSKIYNSLNNNEYCLKYFDYTLNKESLLDKNIFKLNPNDQLLETLLICFDNNKISSVPQNYYQFIKIGEYVYSNELWLGEQNLKDHLVSYLWNKEYKEKSIQNKNNYPSYFEERIENIFKAIKTKSQKPIFKLKKNIEYEISEAKGEIDIIAEGEKVIVFCEVKSSYVRNSYNYVIDNVNNKLNGKASSQLNRLKENINNLNLLEQLDLSLDKINSKEIFYLIVTNTPDFLGQSNKFPICDEILLREVLKRYMYKNMDLSFEDSYKFVYKILVDDLLETSCKREKDYELIYNYYHNNDFLVENCTNINCYNYINDQIDKKKLYFDSLTIYFRGIFLGIYTSNFDEKMNILLNINSSKDGIYYFYFTHYKITDNGLILDEEYRIDDFILTDIRYLILVKNENKNSCLEASGSNNCLIFLKESEYKLLDIINESLPISMIIIERDTIESKVIQFDNIFIDPL